MALNVFYTMVREAAEQLIRREPKLAFSANARICAILAKNYDIISGVSSIYMINQTAGIIPAEYMAVVAMNNADMTRALQMITLSLVDFSVVIPNPSELMIVQSMDPGNSKCNVYISPSDYVPITSLLENEEQPDESNAEPVGTQISSRNDSGVPDITDTPASVSSTAFVSSNNVVEKTSATTAMSGFFSGFGDDESDDANVPDNGELEKMGFISNTAPEQYQSDYKNKFASSAAKEEYSTAVNIDANNPFLDSSEKASGNKDVVYFAEIPNGEANNTMQEGNNEMQRDGNVASADVISRVDLMKQAKQKKKIARANFNIRRK